MNPSLETWHIYGTDRIYRFSEPWDIKSSDFSSPLSNDFEFEMQKWREIQSFLEFQSWTCQRIWFHDDIIPRMKQNVSQDGWRWKYFMNATKQQVHDRLATDGINKVFEQNEFDLISCAQDNSIPNIISAVKNRDDWRYIENKRQLRGPKKNKRQQKIRLLWYRDYLDIPSCEVLDYTFYVQRLKMSSPTVTLISESMWSQQERVRTLFALQGKFPEVIVLYHNGETIVASEYWGKNQDNLKLSQQLENI